MAEIIGRFIIYTADDEMPHCMYCDGVENEHGCKHCGAEYGWNGYRRTEEVGVG